MAIIQQHYAHPETDGQPRPAASVVGPDDRGIATSVMGPADPGIATSVMSPADPSMSQPR